MALRPEQTVAIVELFMKHGRIFRLSDDFLAVQDGGLFGLFSVKESTLVLPVEFEVIRAFEGPLSPLTDHGFCYVEKDGKGGILSLSKRQVILAVEIGCIAPFLYGLFRVSSVNYGLFSPLMGGRLVLPMEYGRMDAKSTDLGDGLIKIPSPDGSKFGIFSTVYSTLVLKVEYHAISDHPTAPNLLALRKGKRLGFFSREKCRVVLPVEYSRVGHISADLCLVSPEDAEYGVFSLSLGGLVVPLGQRRISWLTGELFTLIDHKGNVHLYSTEKKASLGTKE